MENNSIKFSHLKKYLDRFKSTGYSLKSIIDHEAEIENKHPKTCTWKEIDQMNFPENRWLVKNLFPKEGISIVASISGEGKTMLMMHLAQCISEGVPWFGNPEFTTEKSRVLYINLEMPVSEMQRRGRKIGLKECDDLIFINEDDFNLNRDGTDDKVYNWLLEFIYENKISVVIVDTFIACSGGLDQNKADEVRQFFKKFQVLKNSGVSLIFLMHQRKPSHMEGKVPKKEQLLGSQDQTANAEILLMIHKNETSGQIDIYQRKNRIGNDIKPFGVKLTDITDEAGVERIKFEYAGELDDEVNKKEEAKVVIRETLSGGESRTTNQILELLKKTIGQKNIRQALRELAATGEIDSVKLGKQNSYFLPKNSPESAEKTLVIDKELDIFDSS